MPSNLCWLHTAMFLCARFSHGWGATGVHQNPTKSTKPGEWEMCGKLNFKQNICGLS